MTQKEWIKKIDSEKANSRKFSKLTINLRQKCFVSHATKQ